MTATLCRTFGSFRAPRQRNERQRPLLISQSTHDIAPSGTGTRDANLAALRHVPPTIVGAVGMCEPVAAAAVAWAWLGQALRPIQMVGGGVVLAGVALAQQAATSGSHVRDVPATVSPEELRISR